MGCFPSLRKIIEYYQRDDILSILYHQTSNWKAEMYFFGINTSLNPIDVTEEGLFVAAHQKIETFRLAGETHLQAMLMAVRQLENLKRLRNQRLKPVEDCMLKFGRNSLTFKAAQELIACGRNPDELLAVALASRDAAVVQGAMRLIVNLDNQENIDKLVKRLIDKGHGLALIRLGEKAVDALIGALNSKHTGIRLSAINTLGEIGDRRAIAPLKRAQNDPVAKVRECAERALKGML